MPGYLAECFLQSTRLDCPAGSKRVAGGGVVCRQGIPGSAPAQQKSPRQLSNSGRWIQTSELARCTAPSQFAGDQTEGTHSSKRERRRFRNRRKHCHGRRRWRVVVIGPNRVVRRVDYSVATTVTFGHLAGSPDLSVLFPCRLPISSSIACAIAVRSPIVDCLRSPLIFSSITDFPTSSVWEETLHASDSNHH